MIWRTAALVVVALVLLSAGAALPARTAPPAAPTLPETPYRYANLELPPQFNGRPWERSRQHAAG